MHSLDNLRYFLDMIDTEAEVRTEENLRIMREMKSKNGRSTKGLKPSPVKFAAANKVDLRDARQVSSAMGLDWARSHGCGFMETSAREMVNIEETFACKFVARLSMQSGHRTCPSNILLE